MAGWALIVALTLFPQNYLFTRTAPEAIFAAPRDLVLEFADDLRPGQRISVWLMDNQKLKGEFAGIEHDRLLLRLDRVRPGRTLPIRLPAIHSVSVHRGGTIVRP
jgi:hypothetical protein